MERDARGCGDFGAVGVAGVGEGIDADSFAGGAAQLLEETGDDTGIAAEIEAGVEAEMVELAEVDAADEEFAEESVAVASCGVERIDVNVDAGTKQIEAHGATHLAVGGVEFPLAEDGGSVLEDRAVPTQRLRFRHRAPCLEDIVGEALELVGHGLVQEYKTW